MRGWTLLIGAACLFLVIAGVHEARGQTTGNHEHSESGWTVPPEAAALKNPVPATAAGVKAGQQIFQDKCKRCHGPAGKGDGPDGDPKHRPGDLTDPKSADGHPDGVLFYKVWNGRKQPSMPAFKSDLSRQQVWTVINYVKTLRKAS